MISPLHFGFNIQTAATNAFQQFLPDKEMLNKVRNEFDSMVALLRRHGLNVEVFNDHPEIITPDSVFPNNWFSVIDNMLVLYPMLAENRRLERRQEIIQSIQKRYNLQIVIDLTHYENEGLYLEGTGSLVLDKKNRVAYVAISPRTSRRLAELWCRLFNYKLVYFNASDDNGVPVYHTNVLLAVGSGYALLASDMISDEAERLSVLSSLVQTGHDIILLSNDQVKAFAGNMLEVTGIDDKKLLLMSETALKSLSLTQIKLIEKHVTPIAINVTTIENTGGGSVRCMVAEIIN